MAVIGSRAPRHFSDDSAHPEKSELSFPSRIYAGLHLLLEALEYAHNLETNEWNFAIELSCLRRLKLSNSDLRWLVGRGLIDHAIEITAPDEGERSFKHIARLTPCKRLCFMLTPRGAAMCREIFRKSAPVDRIQNQLSEDSSMLTIAASFPSTPKWDRDRQELRIGSIVIKRFRVPAASQEAVLAAFEEEGWPPRIDDPLPPRSDQSPKRRLQETIKSLNRNQKRPLIRFLGDGSAQGILWEFCDDDDEPQGA